MTRSRTVIAFGVIVLVGIFFQFDRLTEFPVTIHAWAQTDRYAIALGFLENDFNLFKPQTYILNHQFPHHWRVESISSVTAVDFPVHDYIAALLMKLTGVKSPLIFKIYVLLYSFAGLFFLFKTSMHITGNYLKSILVTFAAAVSPVFIYYQAGMLPTMPCLANAVIGSYFYLIHLKKGKYNLFCWSIFFFTLAALSRTTFAVPLTAVFCTEFVRLIRKDTRFYPKIIAVLLSVAVLLSYYFYNRMLTEKYGSVFLNNLLPPKNLNHAVEIINTTFQNWFFHYFTGFHYLLFAVVLLSAVFFLLRGKKSLKLDYFSLFSGIYLFGCIVFFILMMRQFTAHDYYFLDTFFLPVYLIFTLLIYHIPLPDKAVVKISVSAAVAVILVFMSFKTHRTFDERRSTGSWNRTEVTVDNYRGSSAFLDSAGVSRSDKILVPDVVAPNIPFIFMERKGYAVLKVNKDKIVNALNFDFDYIVFQNQYFIPEIYNAYPELITKIEKVADNGKITLCKRAENNEQSLTEFMGIHNAEPFLSARCSFEKYPSGQWKNFKSTDKAAYSGRFAGVIDSTVTYGLTYKNDIPELSEKSVTLVYKTHINSKSTADCHVVVSVTSGDERAYYQYYELDKLIQEDDGVWREAELIVQLPKMKQADCKTSVYLWNTGNCNLFYDDVTVEGY